MYIHRKKGDFFLALKSGREHVETAVGLREILNLLSEKDFAGGADALAGLSRALVGTRLETDQALAGPQLFLRKIAFALLRRLRS